MTLLRTDAFTLTPALVGEPFDLVWDRAGMGSLPPEQRSPYLAVLHSLARDGAVLLLETMVDCRTSESHSVQRARDQLQLTLQQARWTAMELLSEDDVTHLFPAHQDSSVRLVEFVLRARR